LNTGKSHSFNQVRIVNCYRYAAMSHIRDALIGQWYLRRDTGETFLVTNYDEESETVEIQTSDGDLDELDEEAWESLPLALAEPPQDWTGPIDADVEDQEDLEIEPAHGKSATDSRESWEDSAPADEINGYTERTVSKDFDA